MVVLRGDGAAPLVHPPTVDLASQFWLSTASEWDPQRAPGWLGYVTDHPPTPHTLRRRTQYVGPMVRLNGQDWRLPLLTRLPLEALATSKRPNTAWVTEHTPADRLAHRPCRELMTFLQDGSAAEWFAKPNAPAPPGSRAMVEHALQRNYRGSWQLWEALGLFDNGAKDTAAAMLYVTGIAAVVAAHDRGEL